ncbi:CHAT domain-containing protein [Streptomyces cinnabarinus]|uniref:CHAT domain-containing protein n=1 Tax=Streptomyces cinnabarinus TaxID=67287 RepID=A0ABY7KKG1_9ACTN|nr:CHAT domain-containing protein [Streptomyces cinnabarinus]WAZ25037.1 CHAT domain-containing protein [Streptomyces cinnabarinus]
MERSAVLGIRQFHLDPASGRPDWWIWSLKRPGGAGTEFTEVRLDAPEELDVLYALPGRIDELRRERVGTGALEEAVRACAESISRTGLGDMAGRLKALGPVVVECRLPAELRDFEMLPWELALVDDVPLSLHGVVFVRGVRPESRAAVESSPTLPSHLRMLALFSLPQTTAPVDLGAHRAFLRAELLDLAAGGRGDTVPVELRTRQFGVSRRTLRGMLREPAGWDVLHVVAHGRPGRLYLECTDGTADEVGTPDLVRILDPACGRTRLVLLSACWSGGQTSDEEGDARPAPASALTSLAASVAERLGCAVVAMRFPVTNHFARAFAVRLYTHLLRHDHTLPQAMHNALVDCVEDAELTEHRTPLFAAATPVLFGGAARSLRLPDRPMTRGPVRGLPRPGVGALPDRPRSFVGRLREMTGVSGALAVGSGARGAVIHGEEGMGATTCASLLAHDHRESFDVILWHPRPAWKEVISPSSEDPFRELLRNLIIHAPGLGGLCRASQWEKLIDKSTTLRLLLVLDAVDRAIAQDPRFGALVEQFTTADGPGRILLTSRSDLPDLTPVLPRTALPPLTCGEMVEILRALPRLGPLARDPRTSALASKVLRRTFGSPGRLMDAEGHAGTVEELKRWIREH